MTLLQYFQENASAILAETLTHIELTIIALLLSVAVGVGLGVLIAVWRRSSTLVLGFVNVVQTIPSVALLGFLLPFFGIGVVPAVIALFLYGLLPIVRNTYTGISGVSPAIREAALGMGMTPLQVLWRVELPLAMPVIFAGVRTAMVINIGVATLCALIAAGGLGTFIFRGIALNNTQMILSGALPASVLALVFDQLLGLLQRHIGRLARPLMVTAGIGLLVWGKIFRVFIIFIKGLNLPQKGRGHSWWRASLWNLYNVKTACPACGSITT